VTRGADGPGLLASRYRLVSRIAAGAVGEVWRGADLVLARPVAVKLLRAEYAQHAETLARFRAEARHAASLAHPGIAQVYDYGDGDGSHPPYLVLELVDGPSLARLLDGGPVDAASTMDVVAQTAAGLQAAHQAGLIHRDIKPGNLLIGPGGLVKITDFGIAYAAGSAPLTRTGMVVGTPGYLGPRTRRVRLPCQPATCTPWALSPSSAWPARRRSAGWPSRWRSHTGTARCPRCRPPCRVRWPPWWPS
jgi:serine/threonine-protein kinase